jgi:hypothetical protein
MLALAVFGDTLISHRPAHLGTASAGSDDDATQNRVERELGHSSAQRGQCAWRSGGQRGSKGSGGVVRWSDAFNILRQIRQLRAVIVIFFLQILSKISPDARSGLHCALKMNTIIAIFQEAID